MTRFVTLTRSGGINIKDGTTCHPPKTGVESRVVTNRFMKPKQLLRAHFKSQDNNMCWITKEIDCRFFLDALASLESMLENKWVSG